MTSSREVAAIREQEMMAYWSSLRAARAAYKAEGICDAINEHQDEIEVIQIHTEWPRMRQMCDELLARDDWFVDPFDDATTDPAPNDPLISSAGLAG